MSSNIVKISVSAFEATEIAGVSGVMPLTPASTFVRPAGIPPVRSIRYTLGMPFGVLMKKSDWPSAENSGFV